MRLHTTETLAESMRAWHGAVSPHKAYAVFAYYAYETKSLEELGDEWEPEAECPDPDQDILRPQIQAALAPFYENQRFADLLRKRLYPPEGVEPAKLEDIGAAWGVSKERVRQVECALLSKLRKVFTADDATGGKE